MFFVILMLILIVVVFIFIKCRKLPLDSLVMINGGVGSGKTSTAVYLAIKSYRKNLRVYKIRKFLHLKVENEPPLLYSNIPLFGVEYVPITNDLLMRKVRFNYKSVVLLSESSLIANSMSVKDKNASEINSSLTLFLKLIRHELHGSYARVPNLIVETQSIKDNHYAFDRCITQSLFILRKVNIPFFRIVKAREIVLVNGCENEFQEIDSKMKWYFISKKVFKKYDSYCYSVLTDKLIAYNKIINYRSKSKLDFEIATFLKYEELLAYNKNLGVLKNENE